MIKSCIALVALGGCYLELGLDVGRTVGPHTGNYKTDAVLTISAGGDFSKPDHRLLVGGTVVQAAGGSVRPTAMGPQLGGDLKVGSLGSNQLRLTGRIAPLTYSWVELSDHTEYGYAIPTFVGLSSTYRCDRHFWCAHFGAGLDTILYYRDGIGPGALIAPGFRITFTQGVLGFANDAQNKAP